MHLTQDMTHLRQQLAPLYSKYEGQIHPQHAYIEIDPRDAAVCADWSGEIGNAVPMPVYYGCMRRYTVPPDVSGNALAELLESDAFATLVDRIVTGYRERWDGGNFIGSLDADAAMASEELDALLDDLNDADCRTPVWGVSDWLFSTCSLFDHWNSCMPLSEAIAELEAEAGDIYLDGDIEGALLDEAKQRFDWGRELQECHIAALLDHGLISAEAAVEWHREQG